MPVANNHMNLPQTQTKRWRMLRRALLLSGCGAVAFTTMAQDVRVDKLENENKDLRARLEALEAMAKKEGIMPSANAPKLVTAMKSMELSGFVQASYFYNTESPADRMSDGYLWNTMDNTFAINKVKITAASPAVERSGDAWDAGYRLSLIFGQDAQVLNTGGELQGMEALREAFVELNAPVGDGLNIKVGQLISLLNYESGDGGAANNNFSQGYQWYYTGNGPAAGIQLGYAFTDKVDLKVRVQNGLYAGPIDGNDPKTVVASLGIKPIENLWVNLIGFAGDEGFAHVRGGSILAGYQVSKPFSVGFEGDYFDFDKTGTTFDGSLWSIGTFLNYDTTETTSVALRAEYLADDDGGGLINSRGAFAGPLRGGGSRFGSTAGTYEADGGLASVTLTFNWKPKPNVRIQPEIRYDKTSYDLGLDGKDDRVIIGAGVSYLF